MIATNYSYGIERDEEMLKKNNLDHRKWTNPLEVQCVFNFFCEERRRKCRDDVCSLRLPHAPTTKIFCVYGHGKETEVGIYPECSARSYFFFLSSSRPS